MSSYYRMFDSEPRGCIETPGHELAQWNRKGFGIFWTVNEFHGPRQIANLRRIAAWAIDMDAGTKEQQRQRLAASPLVPSLIVETKRGYQAYWNAKEARPETWNAIVLDRLVHFFGADKNARDLARILRVPGYLHLKDPRVPFMVKTVHTHAVTYSEWQMLEAFRPAAKPEEHKQAKKEHKFDRSDDFWERVYHLDCEEGLQRLSGLIGESYTFKGTRRGNKNIFVNGKGTSCWIDQHGRIGSLSDGGPTLFQWLKWLRYSAKDAIELLKRVFPELTR